MYKKKGNAWVFKEKCYEANIQQQQKFPGRTVLQLGNITWKNLKS